MVKYYSQIWNSNGSLKHKKVLYNLYPVVFLCKQVFYEYTSVMSCYLLIIKVIYINNL